MRQGGIVKYLGEGKERIMNQVFEVIGYNRNIDAKFIDMLIRLHDGAYEGEVKEIKQSDRIDTNIHEATSETWVGLPKVIEHGIDWYFENDEPNCPECQASGIGNFEKYPDIIFNTESKGSAAKRVVYMHCKYCGCIFEPPRTEER